MVRREPLPSDSFGCAPRGLTPRADRHRPLLVGTDTREAGKAGNIETGGTRFWGWERCQNTSRGPLSLNETGGAARGAQRLALVLRSPFYYIASLHRKATAGGPPAVH